MKRKFIAGAAIKDDALGPRQIRVVASTATPDRVKDVMIPDGCDLMQYRDNPVVLANHDRAFPIGTAQVEIKNGRVEATIDFAPAGASAKADEYCALAKAGVLNAVSVGFEPIDAEPIPGGGERIKSWSLLELSLVSVPANPEALVIARSLEKANSEKWKVGASLNLPIDEDSDWDGPEAAKSIFEKADFDGDDPDSAFARKGFLAYDSGNSDLKGSYKLPFAKVVDGRLTAVASGIRAAASRLPQADLPDDVAKKAREVIDHYEAKMKEKNAGARRTKDSPKAKIKGLYDVAQLAYALQSLGFIQSEAEWEREVEGDASDVPEMLADACRQLGAALVAMTTEEVAELLGEEAGEDGEKSGPVRLVKMLRRMKSKGDAPMAGIDTVIAGHKAAAAAHDEIIDAHEKAIKRHKAARAAHSDLADAHRAARDGEDGAVEDVVKCHKALSLAHDGMMDAHDDMRDGHGKVKAAHKDIAKGHEATKALDANDTGEIYDGNGKRFDAGMSQKMRELEIENLRLKGLSQS